MAETTIQKRASRVADRRMWIGESPLITKKVKMATLVTIICLIVCTSPSLVLSDSAIVFSE